MVYTMYDRLRLVLFLYYYCLVHSLVSETKESDNSNNKIPLHIYIFLFINGLVIVYTLQKCKGCTYNYPFHKCHSVIAAQKTLGILVILINESFC